MFYIVYLEDFVQKSTKFVRSSSTKCTQYLIWRFLNFFTNLQYSAVRLLNINLFFKVFKLFSIKWPAIYFKLKQC